MITGTGSALRSKFLDIGLLALVAFAIAIVGCEGETPTQPAPQPAPVVIQHIAIDDELGAVGGVVFSDDNQNGVQDEGETGLAGLTVLLGGPTGTTPSLETDATGNYLFDDLQPGFYIVSPPEPEGWTLTTPANVQVRVVAGELATVDHGLYTDSGPRFGSITGTVFEDIDQNGMLDDGEGGLVDIEVRMTGPNGLNGLATTDATGMYVFSVPEDGDYSVYVPEVEGYAFTTDDSVTQSLTVEDDVVIDFGLITLVTADGRITGTVFEDANENGMLDDGETGLADIEVRMTGPNGLNGVGTTDEAGMYVYSVPEDGEYTVHVPEVEGWTFTTESTVTQPLTAEADVVIDFGLVMEDVPMVTSIGGMVYDDENGNGMYDEGEPGIAGVQVRLSSRNNPRNEDVIPGSGIHRYDTTDADGRYGFEDVRPGEWRVSTKKPHGYRPGDPMYVDTMVTEGDVVDDADFGFTRGRTR